MADAFYHLEKMRQRSFGLSCIVFGLIFAIHHVQVDRIEAAQPPAQTVAANHTAITFVEGEEAAPPSSEELLIPKAPKPTAFKSHPLAPAAVNKMIGPARISKNSAETIVWDR